MAMGGGLYNGKGYNGGSRGRPIGFMLLVAFGAALMGVVVVHKLRERRIFSLLVKEKDRELVSLHLLFERERDLSKEMKKKNEEMREKMIAHKTQEAELDDRLSELQSTVASLKDEQRSSAMALEEKQNEIRLLKEKDGDSGSEMASLRETLKQKEAQVEDLRHRLESDNSNVNEPPASNAGSENATRVEDKEAAASIEIVLQAQDELGNGSGSIRGKGGRVKGKRWRRRRSEKNGETESHGARRMRSRRLSKETQETEVNMTSIVVKARNESSLEDFRHEQRSTIEVDASEAMRSPDQAAKEGETKTISSPVDGEAVEETNSEKDAEEDTDVADKKEEKTNASNEEVIRDPSSNPDEYSEEYKDETDV